MTTLTEPAGRKYEVTFDRIGRNRHVAPLTTEADGPNHLAEVIYRYARPHLASRDIEVSVDMDAGTVRIFAGCNNGGGGKFVEVER